MTAIAEAPKKAAPVTELPAPWKILPHRYPFLFLDRVLLLNPGVSGVGLKNITVNEHFMVGSQPNGPLFPAAFMAEALAQMSGVVLRGQPSAEKAVLSYLAAIRDFKFHRTAGPGDQLILFSQRARSFGKLHRFDVSAEVDGEVCAAGEITLAVEG